MRCTEGYRGIYRGIQRCTLVYRGVQRYGRCTEVCRDTRGVHTAIKKVYTEVHGGVQCNNT